MPDFFLAGITKVGTAEVTSILGLVATGDVSIQEAAQKVRREKSKR